jgi:hypothetical protein
MLVRQPGAAGIVLQFGMTIPAIFGWVTTAMMLAVGVPLFLRMPLWCDATLYGVAAQTVLSGGVHYRDVFDTNPPGFVWLICGVHAVLGTSSEALRAVDLAIVMVILAVLLVLARSAGATPAGLAWVAAAVAAFYPFSHEFNHIQRDVWMMLPAVVAIRLRMWRCEQASTPASWMAVAEGLLWGLGCWIKPQVFFIAAGVWLVSAGRLGTSRRIMLDLMAVVGGGLLAGLAGLIWLVASGTWPYFLDVWMNWNTSYAAIVRQELPFRIRVQLDYFPPYSVFAVLAVPLAIWNLRQRSSPEPALVRRAILAGFYLAWLITTLLFQRAYHYVHVPETLVMLLVFAVNRWPVPALLVLIQLAGSAFVAVAEPQFDHRAAVERNWFYRHLVDRHPALNPHRLNWWSGCFQASPPPELRRGVARWVDHFGGPDPVELAAVATFLRNQHLHDGELIAWHDSPHVLYLDLGLKPAFRFMHVGTVVALGAEQRQRIRNELLVAAPQARFAVSDLYRITEQHAQLLDLDAEGLPRVVPRWQRQEFPFDQPVVFRSPNGRYLVHQLVHPVRSCVIPARLDQAEPNPQP